jgi:signal transduction histidine kinase
MFEHLYKLLLGRGLWHTGAPLASTRSLGSVDNRMIAAMRLTLASSALLVFYIDPSEPARYAAITYAALTLYIVYSAILYIMVLYRRLFSLMTVAHWIDVAWYVSFIGLSSGTNSIFFFFFYFAILVASFSWGFTSGLYVTLVSAILFAVVGFTTAPREPDFNLNLFLLRPTALVVLGYMMAHWGGTENKLKQRLALLKDISTLSNPRFGVDRMLGSLMERLRDFYDSDVCMLIANEKDGYSMRRISGRGYGAEAQPTPVTEEMAHLLLAPPPTYAMVFHRKSGVRAWWSSDSSTYVCDVATADRVVEIPPLDELFQAKSFISVPVLHHGEMLGRLYLITSRGRPFEPSDVAFLLQVLEHAIPFIDNIRLVDRLASDAAETERQRIARDLHDSIIQPYIGLQIGLAAIRQKLLAGCVDIKDDIEQISELTSFGITELRRYMGGLKDGGDHASSLIPAIQRFARKFTEVTGIAVNLEVESAIEVSDRLAAEVFQMTTEGLSNVRRHTGSAWAVIRLVCHGERLTLCIENEIPTGSIYHKPFRPRSITERAIALGGSTCVEQSEKGLTVVKVDIPL